MEQLGPPSVAPESAESSQAPAIEPDAQLTPLPAPAAEDAADQEVLPADPMEVLQKLGARLTLDADGNVLGLDLAESGVTDADLVILSKLTTARQLNLRGTSIGDEGVRALAGMTQLEFLGLTGTSVTDRGVEHLQKLSELRFLTLGQTKVSDASVETIHKLTRLEGLNLLETDVSAAAVQRLRGRLPNCRIISVHTDDVAVPVPGRDGRGALSPPRERPGGSPVSEPRRLFNLESADPGGRSSGLELLPLEEAVSQAVIEERAQQRLQTVLNEKLHDPDVLRAVADLYMSQQRWHEARQILRLAEPRLPANGNVAFDLAVVEARCGNFPGAFALFESTIDRASAHYNCGVLMYECGRRAEAMHEFEKALVCDPQLEPARHWLAIVKRPFYEPAAEHASPLMSDEQIRRIMRDTFPAASGAYHQVWFGVEGRPVIQPEGE